MRTGVLHSAAAAIFLVLTIAMTWPLAPNFTRAVSDPGDPYIVTWILDWGWWATLHQPLSLYHANIFFPAKYSLAFSENLYGIVLLLIPVRLAGAAPLVAFNIAMIAGFAFSGFAAYLLGRHLTRSWLAGISAGVFYAFVPFRFVHLPHLQHVWGGWLPMLLLALLLYSETPTRRRAMLFAAVFVMNGLTNVHSLFFGAFAAGVTAALIVPRSAWRQLIVWTIVALAILAPFLYPYAVVAKLYGMQRTAEEVARFSATLRDWLPHDGEPERRLYPGVLALVTGVAALFVGRGERRAFALRTLALLWIVIGVLGSLGFNTAFHSFLFGGVPGFRAIRVPARWAVIAYVGLAILAAIATAALARRSRWMAALLPIAFVVTLWQAPIRWYLMNPDAPPVYDWLSQQKLEGGVIELPMTVEYEYMLRATRHHKPIVNGISGFGPPHYNEIASLANATPIPDALLDRLRASGVELIIVHADHLGENGGELRAWLRRQLTGGRLTFVRRFDTRIDGDWVFRIASPSSNAIDTELNDYLDGYPTCNATLMGALDFPGAAHTFPKGEAIFSGWVVSHHGIAAVDVLFENGRVRHRARLQDDPLLGNRCEGFGDVTRKRYLAFFAKRPDGVRRETDVLIEVTDGRGKKTVFDNRWITWE